MSDYNSIAGPMRFYFGASYGSAQTALRRMEEPDVMLSYVTQNNRAWDGIENFFVDCGAFSIFKKAGNYQTSVDDYLDYVETYNAEKFALRDVPCNDETLEITGQSVHTHQERTVELHAECLARARDRGIEASPVAAIQGETVDDYLRHIEMHREAGTLTYDVGIGSLAGRPLDELEEIVSEVGFELSKGYGHRVHGYGISARALESHVVRMVLDSADSSEWSYGQYRDRLCKNERMMHVETKKYLDEKRILQSLFAQDDHEFLASESDVDLELAEKINESNREGVVT